MTVFLLSQACLFGGLSYLQTRQEAFHRFKRDHPVATFVLGVLTRWGYYINNLFSYFLSQSYQGRKKPSPLTIMEDNILFNTLLTDILIYLDNRSRKLRIFYCYSLLFDQSNLLKKM